MKLTKYKPARLLVTMLSLSFMMIANSASAQLNPGCITTPHQTIFINTIPPAIVATAPTGGSCSGAYQYQWQLSTDNINFRDIPGATSATLNYSTPLTTTTYFHRRVTCGMEVKYTNSIQIGVSSTYYYNTVASANFTRNNCPAGGTGSTVTYTVPANTYSSLISVAEANNLAWNDVNANGQTYANANGTCTFYSAAASGNFQRNNCTPGMIGSVVTYTVPAGTYNSTVSQAAANQLAQNDVNANGQNYANTNGSCAYWNVATSANFTRNNCSSNQQPIGTVTYTVPANTYSSPTSQAAADQLAQNDIAANGQNYANANGTCCTFTFSWAPGIIGVTTMITFNGSRVNFTFVFNYPPGNTNFTLGTITSTCGRPTATRQVTVTSSGSTFRLSISPAGTVTVLHLSGPVPNFTIGMSGVYDLFNDLFYNVQTSGNFTRNNCPAGQVGTNVTYTVAANAYLSTVSQADANQLAQNDVNANGQNYANANGSCFTNTSCSFSPSISMLQNTLTSNGTQVTFTLVFSVPFNNYNGGTLGTISTVSCRPSVQRNVTVADAATPGRTWQVTINTNGVISVTRQTGSPAVTNGPPIVLNNGSYNL